MGLFALIYLVLLFEKRHEEEEGLKLGLQFKGSFSIRVYRVSVVVGWCLSVCLSCCCFDEGGGILGNG